MKKRMALLIGLCMVVLAGCGQKEGVISRCLNSYIEDSVIKESAIKADESYARYEEITQEEEINKEGFFYSDEVDYSVLEDSDAVHVTFAVNSYISVQYFDDPAMTGLLNPGGAYLHVNDCIYANIQEVDNPNTDAYKFSGFEVWEYDENGKKKKELETAPFEDGLVFQIPTNFNGKEIAIIPLGEYTAQNITLNDFYKDNNGVEKSLAGTWDINGEKTTGNSTSVSPVAPYTVTYMYDPNSYVFVSSDPICLYNNEVDGIVSFEEFASDQNITSFSVELHKNSGDREFDPDKYKVEHADIEYKYQGVVIDSPTFIPDGNKISYKITRVDSGYWVPGDMEGEVEVGDVADVISNLVCKKEKVKVTLPQPEKGGNIIYSLDEKTLTGDSVEAFIGSEIVMKFQPKNGWSCDAEDDTVYKVVAKDVQKVNVDGRDVNDIFTEQQYKPVVTLTLDKSVGTYTEFEINSVDGKVSSLKLGKKKEVFSEEVGTKNDLTLTASNGALLDGEALKVEIKKETVDGKKESDIRYLQKLPESLSVSLYISNSSTVYKTVNLTVSKVDVVAFTAPGIDNGSISVETTDLTDNRTLRAGDVMEGSRKIKTSISAKTGYYVKDSGKTDIYTDTMTYSKFISNISTVLREHPVKKLYSITLDATDAYGKVTYKIDGEAVEAGTYNLKEEQKLELSYEITDGSHIIVREGSNWFEDRVNDIQGVLSKIKESVEIPITASLDGSTITRDKYIKVK